MKRRLASTPGADGDVASEDTSASALSEMVAVSSEQLSDLIKSVLSRDVLNAIVSQATLAMTPKRFGNVAFGNVEEPHVNAFLHQKLGKDNLSRRAGPRGTKLTYIESCKAIELANQAFGFNGWSCNIIECKEEYRQNKNERWSIGFSSVVRIELKDGTSHEDVGFGQADGQPHLGAAIEQAKKASISDARKRALRLFGEYLGNSCYDREHIKDVHANKPNLQPAVPIPAPAGRPIDHSANVVPNQPRPLIQQSPHAQSSSVADRITALQAADASRQMNGMPAPSSHVVSPAIDTKGGAPVRHGPPIPQVTSAPAPFPMAPTPPQRPPLSSMVQASLPGGHSSGVARQPVVPQQQPQQFMPRNAPPPSRMPAFSTGTPIKMEPPQRLGTEFDINDLSLSQFDYDPTGDDTGGAAKRMRTF